ncbi:MAG: Cna B-type domain-containing protein [Flaviflexus sp.]|nr:Cna B-type domain-containing protein [Flaviflexus sp.]
MTITRPRGLLSLLASLVLILTAFVAMPAHAAPATDEDGLRELIAQAGSAPTEIEIDGAITLSESLVIPAGSNLTLRPATEEGASLLGRAGIGNVMIRVDEGASLTLDPTGSGVLSLDANGYRVRVLDIMGTAVLNDGLITGMSGDPGGTGLPGSRSPRGAVTVTGAGNLTMNGGAIAGNDMGNDVSDVQETGANIVVFSGGTFTLNGGEIRDGRSAKNYAAFNATGGLGLFKSATFTMNGGRITGNDGGSSGGIAINAGSIYWDGILNGSTPEEDKANWLDPHLGISVTINGGEISNNKGYFYGGGIGGFGKFDITMTGGSIVNNWSQFHGGGLHVQDYYVTGDYDEGAGGWKPGPGQSLGYSLEEWRTIVPASFTMTGGTIAGNYAGSSGGGVNIVSDSVMLSGGLITENSVSRSGGMGGGIYVGSQPYTLRMKNVHFADNTAVQGGALWNCPTGHTTLHAEDGAAFTGNTASRFGNDLQVYPIGKGAGQATPEMDMRLATRMLGGEHIDWYLDGYRNRQFEPFVDRYVPGSGEGTLVDPAELKDNPIFIGLAAESAAGGQAIPTCNTLIVSKNDGDMGGGLGTNGNVIIGTEAETVSLKVLKKWAAGATPPEQLEVDLYAGENKIDSATLTKDSEWTAVFADLPHNICGEPVSYSIREVATEGWTTVISDPVSANELSAEVGEEPDITITNSPLVSLKVLKTWDGDNPPEQLQVTLLADGNPVAEATLSAENDWQHIFTGLPAAKNGEAITYTIAEAEIAGWTSTVSEPVPGTDLPASIGPEDPATITLTNSELTELKVEKIWQAGGHELPASVDVTLLADGEEVATATLSAENDWQHIFTALPTKADGKVITYSITEAELDGWVGVVSDAVSGTDLRAEVGAEDPADITLTNTKLTELKVEKIWHAGAADLPESLDVTLLADGEEVATATLSADNEWQHVFTGLPVVKDGQVITYSIAEAELDGWAGVVTGAVSGDELRDAVGADDPADITLTNTKLVSVTGTKVWVGGEGPRPEIELQLMRGVEGEEPEPVGEPQVLADGVTEVTWEGLPATDAEGRTYTYVVEEVNVPEGYEMVRVDNVTVENHLLPPPTDPPTDPPATIPPTDPPSDPPSTVPPTEPPADPPLVHTGASVVHLAVLGALLIAAGTVAVVRRRRAE